MTSNEMRAASCLNSGKLDFGDVVRPDPYYVLSLRLQGLVMSVYERKFQLAESWVDSRAWGAMFMDLVGSL